MHHTDISPYCKSHSFKTKIWK